MSGKLYRLTVHAQKSDPPNWVTGMVIHVMADTAEEALTIGRDIMDRDKPFTGFTLTGVKGDRD